MNGFARGRRRPLPEVAERLASLDEELRLSTDFAALMIKAGQLRSAVGVVDEQRARLASAHRAIRQALGTRRRRRVRAATAGVAVAAMLGSGSYAAIMARSSKPAPAATSAVLVREASADLEQAAASRDVGEMAEIVGRVNDNIQGLSAKDLTDPRLRAEVTDLIGVARQILADIPEATATILAQMKKVAAQFGVTEPELKVEKTPQETTPEPDAEAGTPDAAASTPPSPAGQAPEAPPKP